MFVLVDKWLMLVFFAESLLVFCMASSLNTSTATTGVLCRLDWDYFTIFQRSALNTCIYIYIYIAHRITVFLSQVIAASEQRLKLETPGCLPILLFSVLFFGGSVTPISSQMQV